MPTIIPKNLIKYSTFVFACFFVAWVFITATTFDQLAAGIFIYPLFVIFAYKIFSDKMRSHPPKILPTVAIHPPRAQAKAEQDEKSNISIADIDKRVFLKLIGGAGLSFFLYSLFSKKTEDVFFKTPSRQEKITIADLEGKQISPAQSHPLDGYNIAEIEDEIISFYGYMNKDGSWYVLKLDTVTGSFRYARGSKDFPIAWKNRKNLKYGYFNNMFP